jgi:phytoene synthase
MMTVIDALSSPLVLTAGAVGTMDGLGRVAANLPRYLANVYGHAQGLLAEGSFLDPIAGPVEALKRDVQERSGVRAAILKICIASDSAGDGTVSLDQLTSWMQARKAGMISLGGDVLRPRVVSALTIGEAMGMETEGPFNYVNYFQRLAGSSAAYNTLREDASKLLIEDAYQDCKVLTAEYAKTFYLATRAMPENQARATWAIYAWCRRVDELVDGPDVNPDPEVQKAGLSEWMTRLDNMWEGDRYALAGLEHYDIAFADMIKSFEGAEIEPYRDMVRGMLMDVSDKVTYESWDELYLYCYRVASTVGLMTMPVMGTAKGVTMEEARDPAVALGIALQITNILRDVGEDARDRGRIYLPEEDLRRFGVSSEFILDRSVNGGDYDDKYRELIKFEIARAREYYAQAEKGIELLAPSAQLPVAVAMELYREILNKIELNDYDNLSKRAYLTAQEKFQMVPGIYLKTKVGHWSDTK